MQQMVMSIFRQGKTFYDSSLVVMGYNSPLFLTIWQLISCDRPQMSIISWIPLGPHWLAHVGCIWVLLQLNFQFVPKNKNPKKSIPWGERSLIEWLNNGKINELHPRRCDCASLPCGLGPPPLWGLVMCYLLFNLGEVFTVWSTKVSRGGSMGHTIVLKLWPLRKNENENANEKDKFFFWIRYQSPNKETPIITLILTPNLLIFFWSFICCCLVHTL